MKRHWLVDAFKRPIHTLGIILMLLFIAVNQSCLPVAYVSVTPDPPVVTRSSSPYPGSVWIDGDWRWRRGRYVWIDGYWAPSRPSRSYVPGQWRSHPRGGYRWRKGHWK